MSCALQAGATPPSLAKAEPFVIEVQQKELDRILRQVREHRWLEQAGVAPWTFGIDQTWIRSLGQRWGSGYDWRKAEAKLNRFRNYRAVVDGVRLHFIVERGSGENPTPLVLLHGWPYSIYSFVDVIEPLAHPERFGGEVRDAFDVIAISTAGLGWSDPPPSPENLRATGARYHKPLTGILGYTSYIVHGGDQGAISAGWMAHDFPKAVLGHHIHMLLPDQPDRPPPRPTTAEREYFERVNALRFPQRSYITTHSGRGETLAAALADNPVGQAARMLDKWYWWSDRRVRKIETIYSQDRLLDEVMVYIVTNSFRTSMWPYLTTDESVTDLAPGEKIGNPCGVTSWPDPVWPVPPSEYVERSRANLVQYTRPSRGGHFPMIEEPDLYIRDLRQFGRALKVRS